MVVQTRSSCPKPVTVLDLPPNVLQCIASKLDTKEWAMALCTCRSFAEVQLEVFKLTDGPGKAAACCAKHEQICQAPEWMRSL